MADVIALCVDGTLKGQIQAMPRAGYVTIRYKDIHGADVAPSALVFGEDYGATQIHYRPHRFSMFNRIIWIATCSGEWPNDDDVIELMFTEQVKKLFREAV